MSLKCSILGHSFDETAVERDRQEDGSEVVITITELETCTRCGETRVVSENKEVTTMETPADTATGDAGGSEDGAADPADATGTRADAGTADVADTESAADAGGAETVGAADAAPEPEGGDAEIIGSADAGVGDAPDADDEAGGVDAATADADDDAAVGDAPVTDASEAGSDDVEGGDAEILGDDGDDPEADAQARARTDSTPIPDAESDDPVADPDADEVTDDAVIIDGDTDDRDPGEWPEEADAGSTDRGDVDGTSEVTEAVEGDDAAVWTADDSGDDGGAGDDRDADWPEEEEDDSTESVMGEWPEETTRDSDDAADEGPTLERSASPTVTVPEGMYRCSECGFTTEVESSSLRAGDFCPECHTGTLVQHEDAE